MFIKKKIQHGIREIFPKERIVGIFEVNSFSHHTKIVHEVQHYYIITKTVKKKKWRQKGTCTKIRRYSIITLLQKQFKKRDTRRGHVY